MGHTPSSSESYKRDPLVTWIGLGVIALLLVAYLIWRPRYSKENGVDHVRVGQALPAVWLEPLTGDAPPIRSDDLSGRITLINFWGTWCPPCAEEFPYLAAINDRFGGNENFLYLSVSCRGGDEVEHLDEVRTETAKFLEDQRVTHATYYDPAAVTRQGLVQGTAFPYPMTLLLDRTGVIRGVWEGFDRQSVAEIERLIETLLE